MADKNVWFEEAQGSETGKDPGCCHAGSDGSNESDARDTYTTVLTLSGVIQPRSMLSPYSEYLA